ncbi:sn-glycerol-3-phosphate ABC transporter ATP-binding protein UgpC [Gordonia sp. HY285]|uniref:Sn-glycerol-3-phosphate ABC transporter ATP-binding protein UgpC n=1 Tax=Gordonia liuliyuniae TaxID=2911517 RepID=A0ABS9IXF1_9ACTN|nr:sn-glycerol-3-phosphate ABC transporter ATP-binding protein UgpC [Gordonia liuliyuniae]MCF8590252.1 sn-glycerol-3-phosphate ABC transporter ATP-binding protein UgpC [Gordonia liuliyuniae]MCF8611832.1 sn-glycerol-3-phosphate ABC transporter ATP-binding protein UgpC [Gordonia liuliyuniae]
MADIVLDNVSKQYPDGSTAVHGIDLQIAEGEFIILVGPSGCGKSTTLNMIAGLEDITSGELRIGGARVNETAPKDRDIAMVFQSYALYPHMTVRENIAFPLTLAKKSKDEIAAKVDEAARILDLGEYLDRKPANLSGGQRQRVAMGRAIVRSPKAFLMDEPLSNLDAKLRVQMRTEIANLQARLGTTTVYVTHDQTEAMTLGDRVVVMRAGHVQQVGSPQELYDNPVNLFVAGFIGSPSMNFIPGRLTATGVDTPIGHVEFPDHEQVTGRARQTGSNGEVLLGIRPEHLVDAALTHPAELEQFLTFDIDVDLVESMGSDKYVYFTLSAPDTANAILHQLAEELGSMTAGGQKVARLTPYTDVRRGGKLTLALNTARLHVFDTASGSTLR